ncbi:hypothetical protein EN854_34220, partial [Mesorhizobium sp. M4B.F.Ca.ET.211.01.1.1]
DIFPASGCRSRHWRCRGCRPGRGTAAAGRNKDRVPASTIGLLSTSSEISGSSARMRKAGVTAEGLGRCTYTEEDLFYSYRRTTHRKEADYGRQVSA